MRLAAVEQSRAAAEAERDDAHASREAERREFEAAAQRQRQDLRGEAERRLAERHAAEQQRRTLAADIEHRLAEQAARFAAQRTGWARHYDQLAPLWQALAREVEQAQAGLIDDRNALKQQLEALSGGANSAWPDT
jgi:hypothetical protein